MNRFTQVLIYSRFPCRINFKIFAFLEVLSFLSVPQHKPDNQHLHNIWVLAPSRREVRKATHYVLRAIQDKMHARPCSWSFPFWSQIPPVAGRCVLRGPIPPRELLFPCSSILPSELAVMRRRRERRCGCVQPVGRWHHGDTVGSHVPGRLCSPCSWLAPKQNLS